jgi:hypothetical protein
VFGKVEVDIAKHRLRNAHHTVSPSLLVDEPEPVAEAWLVVDPAQGTQDETAAPWFGRAGERGARTTVLLPISLLARAQPLYVRLRPLGTRRTTSHLRWYRIDTSLYHHTGARYGDISKAKSLEGADIAHANGPASPVCEVILRVPVDEPSITHMTVDWTTDVTDRDVRRVTRLPGKVPSKRVRSTQWAPDATWVSVMVLPGGPRRRQFHWHLDTTGLLR